MGVLVNDNLKEAGDSGGKHTTDSRLLVLLEIVVDESKDE